MALSPFQTQIARDVGDVFLNADEFASWVDLDGTPVLCVWEDVDGSALPGGDTLGVAQRRTVLHFAAGQIPDREAGAMLEVCGKGYEVVSWSQQDWMVRAEVWGTVRI